MIKKNIAFIVVLLGGLITTLLTPAIALGEGEGIKISPVRVEDLVVPGQILQRMIKVTNNSNNAKRLYPYIKDFTADGEEGAAKLLAPGEGDETSMASWIKIDAEGADFLPNEEKEMPFTIEVPENIGPGGYYGAIVFGTQAPKVQGEGAERGAAIAIAQQTGALVLIQVAGDALEEAEVREYSTDKDFYPTPFDVKFMIRIENKGNVHVKPYGKIEITNMFGKQAGTLYINEKGANILPHSIRRFQSEWKGDLGFGRYKAMLILSYGTPANQGGKGMQSIIQDVYFWVFPWKIIIPAFLGIIFLVALIVLFLKFYKSRAVKKAMEEMGMTQVKYVKKIEGPSATLHLGLITAAILATIVLIAGAVYFLILA